MESLLRTIEKLIPKSIYRMSQPLYHYSMALTSAIYYCFPGRNIKVIGVTGTKGKSTTVEIINAILEEAGYKTALSNTIRYKVGNESFENKFKMSMPGRFFVQRLISKAVNAKCDYVIFEMTSQGALQSRHKFIGLNAFVFTNLSPEHIEAHGSYEKYVQAKLQIGKELGKYGKKDTLLIVNKDDKEAKRFVTFSADRKANYSLNDAKPFEIGIEGIDFTLNNKKVHSPLSGEFNLYNLLAGITLAQNLGISDEIIIKAIEKFKEVKGRVERIQIGQDFTVIVDYAHTTDSLEKLYKIFDTKRGTITRKICVLGGTGGGRDSWKRKEMGKIADTYCDEIILTNEDPYDEDPKQIIDQVAEGITNKKAYVIMNRKDAIAKAIGLAKTGDTVLITGKGTDPYIMGPNGTKTPWSDSEITKELIRELTISSKNQI